MDENTNPTPGTTVAPTGDTLNGSNGPVESAHQHEPLEKAYVTDNGGLVKARDLSPVEQAHSSLLESQFSLHDKITMLAQRLGSVLAHPFKGSETTEVKDSFGGSDVARKLSDSANVTANSHDVVDHLLNNLEV
jgi:hypothetical protein